MSLIARNWNKRLKAKIQRTFRRQLVLPRAREAPRHRLPAQVQRAPLVVQQQRRLARAANRDGCLRVPGRLQGDRQQVCRRHHLSAERLGRAHLRAPVPQRCPAQEVQEAFRPRRLNVAQGEANPRNDLLSRVRQVGQLARSEAGRRLSSKVRRRSQSMVARRRDNWARVLPARAPPDVCRRRAAAERLKPNDSGSPLAQANVVPAPAVRRLEFINRSPRRLVEVEDLQVKRAANEKERRALTVSRLLRSEVVARLGQPSATKDNPKVEKENRQKNLHRPDPKNSSVIAMMAPEREVPEPFLYYERRSL